jgi:hypothetical protein
MATSYPVSASSHGGDCHVRSNASWVFASEEIVMDTIVPEVSEPRDELEALVMQLAGHNAFALCRGEMQLDLIYIIENIIRRSPNREGAKKKLREFFGAALIMGNKLAQLHFSGQKKAYSELEGALTRDHFVFTYESVPLDKTRPVTILMLEPEKTIVLLRWMAEGRTAELNRFVGFDPLSHFKNYEVQEVTRELFKVFPSLESHVKESLRTDRDNGSELALIFKEAIVGLPDSFPGSLPLISDNMEYLLHTTEHGGSGSIFTFPIAWMFPGKDQAQVLAMFSRDDQKRVATWQIDVPEISLKHNGGFRDIKIGVHPEHEHRIWEKKAPAFTSKGLSNGHGTLYHSYSLTIDTLRQYRNEIWRNIKIDDHTWKSGPTVIKEGCRPRMLMEVRANREQITTVRTLLGQE